MTRLLLDLQRGPVFQYELSLCIRQQNVVQLITLMLLPEALEISKRLEGENYKKVILSWGHNIRYSSGLQFWNKSIMRIYGDNPDSFKGELASVHNGKDISSRKLTTKNNNFLKCLNQSKRFFFSRWHLMSVFAIMLKRGVTEWNSVTML